MNISMVQECTDSYEVIEQDEGGIRITIDIPVGFKTLWLVKLCELTTTMEEIEYYRKESN
jgi:hypothetical protein